VADHDCDCSVQVLANRTTEMDTRESRIFQSQKCACAILPPRMTSVGSRIKILIADDHAIFRDALRKLLDSDDDITIVGKANNGAECIKKLGKLKPDILLLDLRMPDKNGLAVLEEVNFDTLPTRVIVLTAAEDE
jgi:response regulator RpfG family c-di-GMP phosphodiesterase